MNTNSKTLRFAIFGNEYQPKKSTAILTILSFLEQRGAEIYIDRPFYEFLQLEHRIDTKVSGVFDGNNFDVDYVISMGGDGTLLKAATRVGPKQTPVSTWDVWASWPMSCRQRSSRLSMPCTKAIMSSTTTPP